MGSRGTSSSAQANRAPLGATARANAASEPEAPRAEAAPAAAARAVIAREQRNVISVKREGVPGWMTAYRNPSSATIKYRDGSELRVLSYTAGSQRFVETMPINAPRGSSADRIDALVSTQQARKELTRRLGRRARVGDVISGR